MDPELVKFAHPAEVRRFETGKFEVYRVGPSTLGRATYHEPYVSLHILGGEDYAR